jgi:hypothetical protein
MPSPASTSGRSREAAPPRDERVVAEPGRAHPLHGARKLHGIDVEPHHAPAGTDPFENGPRVAAPAERTVDRDIARRRTQAREHLGQHDRRVAAGWRAGTRLGRTLHRPLSYVGGDSCCQALSTVNGRCGVVSTPLVEDGEPA